MSAAGGLVLIIVPGTSGSAPGTPTRGTTATPADGGGAAVATAAAPGSPGGGYVPPDANEVPFADWALLGRYF